MSDKNKINELLFKTLKDFEETYKNCIIRKVSKLDQENIHQPIIIEIEFWDNDKEYIATATYEYPSLYEAT